MKYADFQIPIQLSNFGIAIENDSDNTVSNPIIIIINLVINTVTNYRKTTTTKNGTRQVKHNYQKASKNKSYIIAVMAAIIMAGGIAAFWNRIKMIKMQKLEKTKDAYFTRHGISIDKRHVYLDNLQTKVIDEIINAAKKVVIQLKSIGNTSITINPVQSHDEIIIIRNGVDDMIVPGIVDALTTMYYEEIVCGILSLEINKNKTGIRVKI